MEQIFREHDIIYTRGGITEGRLKPDFIFPGITHYHDMAFPENVLTMLAAKTTCKDRWRQIRNEAKRIPVKHLLTLEPGISEAPPKPAYLLRTIATNVADGCGRIRPDGETETKAYVTVPKNGPFAFRFAARRCGGRSNAAQTVEDGGGYVRRFIIRRFLFVTTEALPQTLQCP